MDGARFANALVKLDCSPAEMTWKSGIDLLSFGGTKNGCWCAEALIVLNRDLDSQIKFLRKQFGHLFSKTRFISAQFEAYLKDDLWLELAKHSNAMGAELEAVVRKSNRVRLAWPSDSNQIFFIADRKFAEGLQNAGAAFVPFPVPKGMEDEVTEDEQLFRMVTGFASKIEEIEQFEKLLLTHS